MLRPGSVFAFLAGQDVEPVDCSSRVATSAVRHLRRRAPGCPAHGTGTGGGRSCTSVPRAGSSADDASGMLVAPVRVGQWPPGEYAEVRSHGNGGVPVEGEVAGPGNAVRPAAARPCSKATALAGWSAGRRPCIG
jgi:hypothetical protein